ncbi:hypothetical protein ABI59_00465 [Acidobacteria bacterium Mor1]|nr:hypothetical protein ABI59_00465 [Acidobacteria bacterium Mor1]
MSFLRMLGFGTDREEERAQHETETVHRIARELEELGEERARFLAAFAYLLSRVARADMKIDEAESREMERIVVDSGKLQKQQAALVVEMAKQQSLLFGGTENYRVAKEFASLTDKAQKLDLLRCLFLVSAAEGGISTTESNVVRQISDELGLEHRDYIGVRSEFRDRLAVLQDDDEPAAG